MAARRLDGGVIVAIAWATVAVAMTVLIGGQLGLRGWFWLGLAGVPLSYGVVIGARLHRLTTAEEFLGVLKASGMIVAAFGILVSVGLLL